LSFDIFNQLFLTGAGLILILTRSEGPTG